MRAKPITRSAAMITHRLLETLKPEPKAFRIPDQRCKGLAVRVAPSGVVTFDLAYRVAKSKKFKRLSLGRWPDVSLEAARNRAHDLTREARAGRDLIGDETNARLVAEERITVTRLIDEYSARRLRGRLRTADGIAQRIRRALKTVLDKPADELRRRDMRRLLYAKVDAGHKREAEQRRICLNGLFKWAVSEDFLEINPMAGLASFGRSSPRQRVLATDEIRTFWGWLGSGELPLDAADVLRVQLCLGARCTEVGGMRAEEFDLAAWTWRLPAERSKNKKPRRTPIVGIAREILSQRLRMTPSGQLFSTDTGKVLTSMHIGHFLLNHPPPLAKLGSHDLRRTAVTMMVARLHIPLDIVARTIGHAAGSASSRVLEANYVVNDFLEQKTMALTAWDRLLRSVIAGEAAPVSNVIVIADAQRATG